MMNWSVSAGDLCDMEHPLSSLAQSLCDARSKIADLTFDIHVLRQGN
jgi:hypothetical protein